MSARDDGGPAFPPSSGLARYQGMSLLDYFAGQALAGMNVLTLSQAETNDPTRCFTEAASNAYGYANAMLLERARLAAEDVAK